MIHLNIRVSLFLVIVPSLGAQQPAPGLRATSCPAADSVLGPLTAQQRKSHLNGWYSAAADRSFIRIDNAVLSSPGLGASVSWMGRDTKSQSSAQVEVSVPTTVLQARIDLQDSLSILVNDTLRLEFGAPKAPSFRGDRMPRFAPIIASLSLSNFLALSRAATATVSFRGVNIKAGQNELAALNALFRAFTCDVVLPER